MSKTQNDMYIRILILKAQEEGYENVWEYQKIKGEVIKQAVMATIK